MKTSLFGKYRVIVAGKRGFVVHIPMALVRMNNIKAGQEVAIYTVEDNSRYLLIELPKKGANK